jgi:hypothetical protein
MSFLGSSKERRGVNRKLGLVMRVIFTLVVLASFCFCKAADTPFPDSKANHWVFASMNQIKADHLWYRVLDGVPRRAVQTREDMAIKTVYLAIDARGLIGSLKKTTAMVAMPADDPATKKWAANYMAGFPKKKMLYQNHLKRVTRLWNYFKPEIRGLAKYLKVDPKAIGAQLISEKKGLDAIHLKSQVALLHECQAMAQ